MPQKPLFEKYLQSFTPFYTNNDFDRQVLNAIDQEVIKYKSLIHNLNTFEGIDNFIRQHGDGVKIILSLIDLSGERFKRIVTTLRINRGDIVSTEWSEDRIRKEILNNYDFKSKIINLFLKGSESDISHYIPAYYLENVKLDSETISKLSDEFYLKRIFKKVGDGKYNNSVGDMVENLISKQLDTIYSEYGVTYSREKFVPWIKRNMDFCIPDEIDPYVIIESSFQVTTGSGQTTKREVEVETSVTIRSHNIQNNKNIAFVNLCDGAGCLVGNPI